MGTHGGTDAAALAGGVVAIAMTMFAEPGPYDELGVVVAVTLAVLLFAYVRFHRRDRPQSIAVAAVAGVVGVPVVAYGLEMLKLGLWTDCGDGRLLEPFAVANNCRPVEIGSGELASTVMDWWAAGIWLVIATIVYVIETNWWQPKLKRLEAAKTHSVSRAEVEAAGVHS